jgi:hypothetical protein
VALDRVELALGPPADIVGSDRGCKALKPLAALGLVELECLPERSDQTTEVERIAAKRVAELFGGPREVPEDKRTASVRRRSGVTRRNS